MAANDRSPWLQIPANPFVAEAVDPGVRSDYIHVGVSGPQGLGRVRSVRRAGDGPVDGVWPSNHAAVVADLRDGRTD